MKYNAAGSPVLEFGQIGLRDDELLTFGDAEDFRFYHDGTDSYIENDTGDLIILGNRDINDPVGGVYILDALAFSGDDGGRTSLTVGLTEAQTTALWGGVDYGAITCTREILIIGQGGAGRMSSLRVNGDYTTPTAVLNNQNIFNCSGSGWDGSSAVGGFGLLATAAENWSVGANGTQLAIRTTAVGAAGEVERLRVFTNGALVVDGAVGTPAWSFLNDTDCGMYRIGTNNIGLGVAGANVLNIATTGLTVTGLGSFTSTLAWGGGSAITSSNSVAQLAASSNTFTGIQVISATAPRHRYIETGVTADNTTWEWCADGETFAGRALDDAVSAQTSWLIVNRTANTIDEIELNATTFDFNGTLDVDGVNHDISTSGTFTISGTGETLATFADDGAVTLYHNNTSRIATSATGVDMVAGPLLTVATATGSAGLRLPHGTAPSAPVDGDIWTTTSGLYARINGATVGPLS